MIIIIIYNHEKTTFPLYRTFRLNAIDKTGYNACFTAEVKQRGAI